MQKRIIKNNIISIIIVAVMTIFICLTVISNILENTMKEQAYSQTMLLMHIMENSDDEPISTLEAIENEIYGRITFVDKYGIVKYDSDFEEGTMGLHSEREEVIMANRNGIAMSQRVSETTGRVTYYCAAQVKEKGVVRIGIMPSNITLDTVLKAGSAMWLSISIITIVMLIVSSLTTQRIVENIETYDIENGEGNIYPELSHFVNKIKRQNEIINYQIQNLQYEKSKLQSIFVSIKEGIIVCDRNRMILQTNQEAQNAMGCTGEDMFFDDVVEAPQLREAVTQALKGETVHTTFKRNDEKWYQTITSPSVYAGMPGAIMVILDITQQMENEQNRRQFTDNVTHELKTPLTSIYGYSQLITNDLAKKEDIKNFVKIIENNAATLLEMIDDIIRISNMETGYGFVKEPVRLDEIVSKTIEQETFNAENLGVTLNSDIEPVTIEADETQMYNLINNLVTNAIKYNKEGGKVDVKLYRDGGQAVLTVKDTGIGIPMDKLDQVFERFYVVDKSRNKNRSSTGLGLAIVKHVVKAHEGTVSVKSQVGNGSEFIVKLPIE